MASILVIEDNPDVRDNMSDILQLAGYSCYLASGGKEGVEKAIDLKPDLILCDVMMPDLDGFGVLKILGERQDTAKIPFVFVTALGEQEDLRRGMNLGADDYVTKPFYKDELLRIIEIRLRKQRARQIQMNLPVHWTGFLSKGALDQALEDLLETGTSRIYKRGEALFREGEKVRDCFCLFAGHIKLQLTTDFGKTVITCVLAKGDFFGYPELIAGRDFQHDAIALNEVEVMLLPREAVKKRMATDANVANMMLGM